MHLCFNFFHIFSAKALGLDISFFAFFIFFSSLLIKCFSIYFGDLTIGRGIPNAASNRTIGLWAGGFPGALSSIEFINISTSGNGQEFGDLTFITRNLGSVSDSHGGLGGF